MPNTKTSQTENLDSEFLIITRAIFKGKSRFEISKLINCSRSSVQYKIGKLFKAYRVSNRLEFIVKVMSEIIDRYSKKLDEKSGKIKYLEAKIAKLERIIADIAFYKTNKTKLSSLLSEASLILENS